MSTLRKTPKYVDVDGYRCPSAFLPDVVRAASGYHPKKSDVFVATYPKCGTTWMIQIVLLLLRRGELPSSFDEYFSSNVFLEFLGAEAANNMRQLGCIKTHFPLRLTPFSPKAKYIYVARNPKDCCVSFYHHTRFFPLYFFTDGSFEDFFELFVKGMTDFNDYFDNLLPWYERRHDPNVFFTTFEDMKVDRKGTVLKVAEFLGAEILENVHKDNNLLNRVLQRSTLEYMKTDTNNWWKKMAMWASDNPSTDLLPAVQNHMKITSEALKKGYCCVGDFVRKGNVGEWKVTLTADQERRLNERIRAKTKHSDVMSLWN